MAVAVAEGAVDGAALDETALGDAALVGAVLDAGALGGAVVAREVVEPPPLHAQSSAKTKTEHMRAEDTLQAFGRRSIRPR